MNTDPLPVCILAMPSGSVREVLARELTIEGHEVVCADSIAAVEARCVSRRPDLLIAAPLDEPAAQGTLLRGLRGGRLAEGKIDPGMPAIAIVPRDLSSVLRAFECGADDAVTEPLRYAELRARLGALLARVARPRLPQLHRIGELSFDVAAHTLRVAGEPIELCNREWTLAVHLAEQPTRVFTKDELLRDIWGHDWPRTSTRTLDSHACRLRKKLTDAGAPGCVINVWGVGYRLMEAAAVGQAPGA